MKNWVKLLLASAVAVGPTAALAAIDNTHHDMPYVLAGQPDATIERCAFCHSKVDLTPISGLALGKVGGFCAQVCHSDTAGLADSRPEVVPAVQGAFTWAGGVFTLPGEQLGPAILADGHGMSVSALGVFAPTETANVAATGWPYTQGTELQCTSCHSVHDAANPPFLNARLSDNRSGTDPLTQSFCQRCHGNEIRYEPFTTAKDHPIEFQWNVTAAAGRNTGKTGMTATVMNGRELTVDAALAGTLVNVVATGVGDTATDGAMNALTANWNAGGHLLNPATGLPTTTAGAASVSCASCHVVHNTGTVASNPQAQVYTIGAELSTVCYGCHNPEPGMSNYGHPINEEVTTYSQAGWPALTLTAGYTALTEGVSGNAGFRPPLPGAPWCVSCHDVHDGIPARMAIRQIGTLNADGAVCELCHEASYANPTVANSHHPGQLNYNYAAADIGFPAQTGWITADGLGDLDDGLSCPDCHVGDGSSAKRATAHNWN